MTSLASRAPNGGQLRSWLMQADLFAPDLIPGMRLQHDVITPGEERDFITHIDETALAPFRFQGWTGKRLTSSFGYHYDFDQGRLLDRYPIQGATATALEAIFHVTEHFSMHTGQIIMLTKMLVQKDLNFYDFSTGAPVNTWHESK